MGKYDLDTTSEEERSLPASSARPGGKYSLDNEPPAAYTPPAGTPRTWWDTAKNIGQTADDAVRAVANTLTLGMADRLAGAMPGTSTDEQVRLSEAARKRSPYASIAGDVGGAIMLPGIGGRQLAARYGGGLLARGAGFGAEGAAYGAAQGAGNTYTGKPLDYITNAGIGAGMGGVFGAGFGAAFGPRGGRRSTAETPSTADLWAEKNINYRDLNRLPQMYEPGALATRADDVERVLRNRRFNERDSPVSFDALNEMRGAPTAFPLGPNTPVAPGDIDFIRKGMSNINPVTQATDRTSSGIVKRGLDDFMRNPPPGAVLPGMQREAAQAAGLAERAHGNVAANKRGQFWDDLVSNAQDTAGATYSGLNLQNFLRQGVRTATRQTKGESPASKAGFNPAEIDAMRGFARVPAGDAALRFTDRVLGGGGGLGFLAAGGVGGGALGHYFNTDPTWGTAAGFAFPAAGLALRAYGNRRALQNVNELGDMIRQRSPLYQERAATAPTTLPPGGGAAASARDALTLELLRRQLPSITVTPREEE